MSHEKGFVSIRSNIFLTSHFTSHQYVNILQTRVPKKDKGYAADQEYKTSIKSVRRFWQKKIDSSLSLYSCTKGDTLFQQRLRLTDVAMVTI